MIKLIGIARRVVGRTLFESVDWSVRPGDRIGLIGANGCGKSSLLRIMAGADEPDEGRVVLSRGARVAWIPQEAEAEAPPDATLLELVLSGAQHVRELGVRLHELESRMARPNCANDPAELSAAQDEYGELRQLFEWFGGDSLPARARVVLGGLGFAPGDDARPVSSFSGGWRKRALLARLLLSGAELLLLDEPTNHLDLAALSWLERELSATPAGLVLVSHDRVFLDRVTNRMAWLERGRLRVEKGGYADWVKARERERANVRARDARLAARERHVRRFVERFGAKATKASQAGDRKRMLAEIEAERSGLVVEALQETSLRWPEPPLAPDPLLRLESVAKRYGEKTVFSAVDLTVRPGDRLAVMGPNGAGKTTLLGIVGGTLPVDGGTVQRAKGLAIGRFAQHQLEELRPDATALEEIGRDAGERTPEQLRGLLGWFGLGADRVDRQIRTLSGGERARLALARLMLRPCHLLLFDEPTNHLDLPMREALERSLALWRGAVMIVSHDRAFVDHLTDEVIDVTGGALARYAGGWREWQEHQQEEVAAQADDAATAVAPGVSDPRSRAGRRARAQALQRRLRALRPLRERAAEAERMVADAERQLEKIDRGLVDPSHHADGEKMAGLTRRRADAETRLEALYEAWDAALSELEVAEREQAAGDDDGE